MTEIRWKSRSKWTVYLLMMVVSIWAGIVMFPEAYIASMAFYLWAGFAADRIVFDGGDMPFFRHAFALALGTCSLCIGWEVSGRIPSGPSPRLSPEEWPGSLPSCTWSSGS